MEEKSEKFSLENMHPSFFTDLRWFDEFGEIKSGDCIELVQLFEQW